MNCQIKGQKIGDGSLSFRPAILDMLLAFPIAHQDIYMQNSVMGGFYEKLQIFSNGKN